MKKILLTVVISFLAISSQAQIRLPDLIGSKMVLQREATVTIWGWADKGEKISVEFNKKRYRAIADDDGRWKTSVKTGQAGGPYRMVISGKKSRIELTDILLGDVWLCSGQSNMVHYLGRHQDRYRKEISQSDYPEIRQIIVPDYPVLSGPADEIKSTEWKEATPRNVLDFSVVGYFFAKHIYDRYQVPIGLIKSAVGGTPIQAWISEEGLKEFPSMLETIRQNRDTAYLNHLQRQVTKHNTEALPPPEDLGLTAEIPWYDLKYKPKGWSRMNIPGYWEDQGVRNLNGTVWFRKEINVPESLSGLPATINMGRIINADNIYINGEKVGGTGYQYPQRRYGIRAGLLKKGKNLIVVQVKNYGGKGGFVPDKPYYLANSRDTLDLKGYWHYKVGNVFRPAKSPTVQNISRQNQPAALYNGMIAPFTDFRIKGTLWYQGESNTWRADAYDELMKALIRDWRKQWNTDDLPFLYVQLPNFMEVNYLPEESNWAELRFSQLKALDLDNTAMTVTLNLGEWNDIHPGNKKPVGDRLALAARNMVYGEKNLVYSGPVYRSAVREGNKIILSFDHVGSGLISADGEPLRWFSIADESREFVWAQTEIKDNQIIVWNEEIKRPLYVRYAWMDNPDQANFFNQEGLPASPFEAAVADADKLWYGKKASVVLTYDDALEVHIDHVVPALEKQGFKATFYVSGAFPGMKRRIEDWKTVASRGHELGNHTLYHPCNSDGRDWVTEANDLSKYTTEQMVREIEMMNVFLQSLDGKTDRTFAYTCGDTQTGEGSFIDAIRDKFVAMRGVHNDVNHIESLSLSNVNAYVADGNDAAQMIKWAEKAKRENAMLVILFHGVGGGHGGNVALEDHEEFLSYLQENQDDFWITTMIGASQHVIEKLKSDEE